MRTKLRSKVTLLFMTCALLLAIPAIVLADNVKNDVVAGGNDTTTVGTPTTVNYEIQQTGSGGLGGCDATTTSPVTVNINAPAGVTASPSSLSFSSCGTQKAVQFSSNTAGNHDITVSTVDNVGDYNVSPAKFTLHVTNPPPPPNTAPTLSLPDNQTAEATGPGGATVSFNATANDAQDGPLNPTCTPASGSIFPLGSTQVNCSVTDSGGLSASGFFTVTVQDTTAPSIAAHDNVTAEATSADGAVVNYINPTASDQVDEDVAVTCAPESGSTFALGTTAVTCTAIDDFGNTTQSTFTVTVEDTTAPELTLPGNITEEATGPSGAAVSFNATASDQVDGEVDVTCDPASGSTFALGTTTVDCSATDAAGNTANGSFTVKVQDTIAPSNIQFVGGINDGDSFFFGSVPNEPTCDATDGGSGLDTCVVSGYSTAVGSHTLKATATDKAGNTATKEITYTVKAWTTKGFYQPVDMNGVYNTVKGGSTVPLKFELFAGSELTDTASIKSLQSQKITCSGTSVEDAIEATATGGTSLRYDSTGGQFIYNWKTPTGAGSCHKVTLTAQDGSTIIAFFKMK